MSVIQSSLSPHAQSLVAALEQQIVNNDIDVPMLPEVANKALILAQNPDSDASEMAKLIQGDQSLAGHVMRIANSAAYTPLANLVSLQQAIARLGMQMISEIALTASLGAKFFNTPGYDDYVKHIWHHALATGLWAKEIARHCRSNVEVSFLAGLLHSIGRPTTIQSILDLANKNNLELSNSDVMFLESQYAKQVTQAVIKAWEMPTLVIESVDYYDNFEQAPTTVALAALINAGSQFATYMLTPDQLDEEQLKKIPALITLNLYQDEVEKLLLQTEAVTAQFKGLSA